MGLLQTKQLVFGFLLYNSVT